MREISIRHLFWKVILGWKCLIVCAVLFAILLPGVKYAKDAQTYKAAQQPQDTVQEVTFTKDEQQQIDDVKSLQVLLDKNSAYMQNSILMNIDPYQEHVLELQYYIDSDYIYNYSKDNKKDYTSAVTNAYVDYAVTGLIKSYREQITTLTSTMTEDQLKVVDSEMEESQDDESANASVTVSAPVLSKKYIVLGFVMGVFLAALYLVCVAVLSNKLQEAEEKLRTRLRLPAMRVCRRRRSGSALACLVFCVLEIY